MIVAADEELTIIKNYQFSLYIFCQTDIINKCAKDICSSQADTLGIMYTDDIEIG